MAKAKIIVFVALLALAWGCSEDDDNTVELTYKVPLQEGAYWPKFRRTADNRGYSPILPGKGQAKVWSFATGKMAIHGTAMLARKGEGGKRPAGLTVAAPFLKEATAATDGSITAKLGGTLPTKDHLMSILLLDRTSSKPLPLNYSQKTTNTVDSSSKITEVSLTFKAADGVKKGAVEAVVIHDLFPLGRFQL